VTDVLNVSSTRLVCATVVRMLEAVSVRVPELFAEELVSAGFRKVRRLRGGGFEPVLTFVMTSATLAVDAATILVAKDAIGEFVERVRSWMARRARSEVGGELVIEVSWRSAGTDSRMRLVARCAAPDAVPEVDTQALASLLSSLFAVQDAREKRGDAIPPA
jgi:hypothetical protein